MCHAPNGKITIADLVNCRLRIADCRLRIGFDHEKLTYRFNGRDYRLTDVEGQVVKAVIA